MNNELIAKEQAVEDVRILAERMAMLYYYFMKNIAAELGQEQAEKLTAKVIEEYGMECGKMALEKVSAKGKENTIANHAMSKDLPQCGWVVETLENNKNKKVVKTTYCPFAETWKNLGCEKWGRMYCYVDQAKFKGYNAELTCVHNKNLLDGDDYCILTIEDPV